MFARRFGASLLALAAIFTFAAPTTAQQGDIVDVAVEAGSFNTLVAALQAAGLVDALKGDGPFTVFAPTDAAFDNLPEGTVEFLLLPENIDMLVGVLTYHVVAGTVPAAQVATLNEATTLAGLTVSIEAGMNGVKVNGANVVQADILATNGIIHVIDAVLLPPTDGEMNRR